MPTAANEPYIIPGTNVQLDRVHADFPFFSGQMTTDVWTDKYRWDNEKDFFASIPRIVNGVFAKDQELPGLEAAKLAKAFMQAGLWMPAGRIMAGAGTTKVVTLLNCFVNGDMQDNMKSITQHLGYMMLTMQQGGGMGTYFGKLRPSNAVLKRTGKGARASGPLPFMDTWNAGGVTIESAGARRGAQMGTINDTHPDLPAYIVAKRTPGRLTNFNISVLISDAFMNAVADDADWALYFEVPPIDRTQDLIDMDFVDETGTQQYVYAIWRARELWELITRNTYEYSEPGIIFIDRVNELNNLHYLEDIRCTNPCGEQPLPPHNACDLGHVVLSRMVKHPFTEDAYFDFDLLRAVVRVGQRFLDNVWDVTNFPLEEQREECLAKRRTGLGFTGLADAFAQMGYRYGSARSAVLAEKITQAIAEEAYNTSVDLAIEKGSFPLFDADQYLAPNTFAGSVLPADLQARIRKYGIRNGVLLTIAPTGTSSIVYGNPQGGLEPFFALQVKRNVLQPDGSQKAYINAPYAVRLWRHLNDIPEDREADLPAFFNSVMAGKVSVDEHILIQGRCQRWIDASISKTTNIPKEMPYEEFVRVYDLAYANGCKGCTTYRPSDVRGSVLEDASAGANKSTDPVPVNILDPERLTQRPDVLQGATYKIKWPRRSSALYLTINSDLEGRPYEIFLTGKDGTASDWTTALSLMITGHMRRGGDISFIYDELKQVQAVNDGAFIRLPGAPKGVFMPSLPAYIGNLIEYHMTHTHAPQDQQPQVDSLALLGSDSDSNADSFGGSECPSCKNPHSLIHKEGCDSCTECGYSHCG